MVKWTANVAEAEKAIQERVDRIRSEGGIEDGLIAIALGRCINTILAQYPPEKREQLAAPICDFIEKPQADRDAQAALISPVERNLISGATNVLGGKFRKH